MSQQSIRFWSSETETYGKQQPARTWPRLSRDLFKEAIHTFSPRRGLLGKQLAQHRDVLVGFPSEQVTGVSPGRSLDGEASVLQPLFSNSAFEILTVR